MVNFEGVEPQMIANNLTSSFPIHPGELIKDEMEFIGLTQKELAKNMNLSPSILCEILKNKRRVSAEYALLFEAALGINAEILVQIQSEYDMREAKSNKTFLKKLAQVQRVASVL